MTPFNERANFIEDSGLFFEALGMTRMAGRIIGYLMVTDKEMVSFDELTQVLQASKSAISTNLKSVTHTKFVKMVSLPGDRKTYYMLNPDIHWGDYIQKRADELTHLKNLLQKGFDLRTNKRDHSSQWLEEAIRFYDWLPKQFPALLKKWEEEERKNSG
jgi:hypothetical protein